MRRFLGAFGGGAPGDHCHRQQDNDRENRVMQLEDQFQHIADGDQLDKAAERSDKEVFFQVGFLPARDCGGNQNKGDRHQNSLDALHAGEYVGHGNLPSLTNSIRDS